MRSDPQGLTALVDRYLLWMETHHYAPGTVKVRRVTLSHFLRWCLERSITRPHTVTPEMLERFQRHVYYYRQRNGQGLSLSSQSHRLTALRRWFAWLAKQHVLEHDPARDLVLPREERRLPRQPLSVAEVEAVLAQADLSTPHGLRNRAILEVLYSTGLRRKEALRLEHTDLDRERRTLLVRSGKGKKDRFVPIGQRRWRGSTSTWPRPGRSWRATPKRPSCSSPATVTGCMPISYPRSSATILRGAGINKPGACHLFRHRQRHSCSKPVRTCVISRLFWVTRSSSTTRSTRTSRSPSCARCTSARIRRASSACPTRPQPPATDHGDDEDDGDLEWVPVA